MSPFLYLIKEVNRWNSKVNHPRKRMRKLSPIAHLGPWDMRRAFAAKQNQSGTKCIVGKAYHQHQNLDTLALETWIQKRALLRTSIEGIVTDMWRSFPSFMGSSIVMQWELSTFCAGSWPVAMKMAVTILLAWALKPPRAPAIAEPARFLIVFSSTSDCTLVFRTFFTTSSLITASQTTDFPRPSIQFTAAGFLSEQKLPDFKSERYWLAWENYRNICTKNVEGSCIYSSTVIWASTILQSFAQNYADGINYDQVQEASDMTEDINGTRKLTWVNKVVG